MDANATSAVDVRKTNFWSKASQTSAADTTTIWHSLQAVDRFFAGAQSTATKWLSP